MIDFSKVDKWSIGYQICRWIILYPFYRAYYRKIKVVNKQVIPYNRPVIFSLNHQNALMDALPFVFLTKMQVVFLARADIFRKTRTAKILRWLKIMPVFRIRDGAENLSKNDSTFLTAAHILSRRNKLGMMPEGNHGIKRQLRPLNKGIFRIAMKAQEEYGEKPGVVIIPVGYEFSHYQKFRGSLFMNFGEPIEVNKYYQEYQENMPQCFNNMRNELKNAMSRVMIDIKTKEYYHTFEKIREMYRPNICRISGLNKSRPDHQFRADKETLNILDQALQHEEQTINALHEKTASYFAGINKLNLRDWVVGKGKYNIIGLLMESLLLLLLFPIHIIGMTANYIPYKLPSLFLKKIKDPQFVSSFAFVLGVILFYLYYLLIVLPLVLIFVTDWWFKLIMLAGLPVAGLFAIEYYFSFRKLKSKWKFLIKSLKKDPFLQQIKNLRSEIIHQVEKFRIKYHS
jgi:1-acyl-sn-glycerol-3-phosphate acyltransferase